MNVAAGPELAAAVTNAGGLGVIGGVGYTPKILRSQVMSYIFFASRRSSEYTQCREGNSSSDYLYLDTINQSRSQGQKWTFWRRLAHSASWWKCS